MNHPEEVKALMLGESQKAELVTESSIQHTPTPWIVSQIFRDKNKLLITQLSGERNIAHIEWERGEVEIGGTDEANAELICRAVNSHEALVSALRGLLIIAEGYLKICLLDGLQTDAAEVGIAQARAALQAARGQQ